MDSPAGKRASETIVVTGGAGFIGSNFVRHLLARGGLRVVVLDKLTYAGSRASLRECETHADFEFVEGDIADRAAVRGLFERVRPRFVVNFAAETHVDRSIDGPDVFLETNVRGVFELLESSRALLDGADENARRSFRFLQVSTDEVYGSLGETGLFRETTPYDPSSPYSASKAAADHFVRAYHATYGLPAIITNCSNNYGPFQFPEKLIPLMIRNALAGRPLPIYGDGGNVRDWLYVEDHCAGILLVLREGRPGESYNIGGSNERTNLEIVDMICDALESIRPAAENPALDGVASYRDLKSFVPDRPGHDRRYAIDATKISSELGWSAAFGLEAGLPETVRWYVDNDAWCREVEQDNYGRERLGLGTDAVKGGGAGKAREATR